ncbi:MAG: hypothetical protein GJU76_16215, partial [Gallionella sp.]|nr:hypothetical protein [Gallionella sp.]
MRVVDRDRLSQSRSATLAALGRGAPGAQAYRVQSRDQQATARTMKDSAATLGIGTRLAQLGRMSEAHYGFVNTPLYRGSTVLFKTLDDLQHERARYSYGTA